MRIIVAGVALLFTFLLAHLILWKIRLPKRHIASLLIIISLLMLVWALLAQFLRFTVWEALHAALFFGSMSFCYVIAYSAIEGDSPTLSLMRFVGAGPAAGCSFEEIEAFFAARPFIRSRIEALLSSSLIRQDAGRYFIAGKPSLAFRLILAFRMLFGTIAKGG